MKIIQNKSEKSHIELEIEVSAEEFNSYLDQAVLDLSQNVEMQGFRKGKAPKELVEKRIGEERILQEALERAVRENYLKAVKENNFEPISSPEIQVLKIARGNPLAFKASFHILPSISLPDYKEIAAKIKKEKIEVSEEEIEAALSWARKSRAKFSAKLGKAENQDFVEIEYWIDGKEIKDAFILGEGHLLGDLEKELIGMEPGQEKDNISIDVPENHPDKAFAGKKIKIKVKMVSIQKAEFPELNDEFAKSLGNFKDLAEFKNNVKEGIRHEKEHEQHHRLHGQILSSISKEIKWDIPDFLVQEEQKRMLEDYKFRVAESLKISFEEYLKRVQKAEKEIQDSFLEEARIRTKNFLILKNIQEKENISASEEEIKEEIDKTLNSYPDIKKAEIDLERLRIYTEGAIKNDKTFKLLESYITP